MSKGYIIRLSKPKFLQCNIIFEKEAGRERGGRGNTVDLEQTELGLLCLSLYLGTLW